MKIFVKNKIVVNTISNLLGIFILIYFLQYKKLLGCVIDMHEWIDPTFILKLMNLGYQTASVYMYVQGQHSH